MAEASMANSSWPYLFTAAFCAAAFAPTAAHAACMVSIEPSQDQLIIRHNPLEAGAVQGTVEVSVVNRGDSECVGTLGASLHGERFGFRSDSGAQIIPYQLIDEKSRNDITPRAGRNIQRPGGRAVRLRPGERSIEMISIEALPEARHRKVSIPSHSTSTWYRATETSSAPDPSPSVSISWRQR